MIRFRRILLGPGLQRDHPRVELRPARPSDGAFLRRLFVEARPELAVLPPNLIDMQLAAQQAQYQADHPDAVDELIEVSGTAVGRCWSAVAGNELYLLDLAVAAEHRRQGIGRAVLDLLVARADRGGLSMRLSVWHGNAAAHGLYVAAGFVDGGEAGGYLTMTRSPHSTTEAPLPIAGLIFHASRSGSTLTASACRAWQGTRVVNESPDLDQAITADRAAADGGWARTREAFGRLARPGADGADRVVVKLDSWHTLVIDELTALLPTTPWLFVYRSPWEILASHTAQPGSQMVPGVLAPTWFGPPAPTNPSDYAASVLGRIFLAAAQSAAASNLLNYSQLPDALLHLPTRLALDPARFNPEILDDVRRRNAKWPTELFDPDRPEVNSPILRAQTSAVLRFAEEQYLVLDSIRTSD